MDEKIEKSYLISDAAKLLGLEPRTLRQWVHDGYIKAYRLPGKQTLFIFESEIKRLQSTREEVGGKGNA